MASCEPNCSCELNFQQCHWYCWWMKIKICIREWMRCIIKQRNMIFILIFLLCHNSPNCTWSFSWMDSNNVKKNNSVEAIAISINTYSFVIFQSQCKCSWHLFFMLNNFYLAIGRNDEKRAWKLALEKKLHLCIIHMWTRDNMIWKFSVPAVKFWRIEWLAFQRFLCNHIYSW